MKNLFIVMCSVLFVFGGCGGGGDNGDGPCKDVDCSGHGDCVEAAGAASCDCDSGYHAEGLSCVEDDPCAGVTCSGHGTCIDNQGTAECQCETGYHAEGLTCVADDPCAGVTCSGHGTCILAGGIAVCDCDAGYHHVTGPDCVADGPCDGVDCSGHGTCVDNQGTPECQCDQDYHADGLRCLPDVDPCLNETCSGHGTCVVDNDGYPSCQCEAGYNPVGLECVEEGQWPPTLDSLYEAGTGCTLPACDTNGDAGVDTTGNWQRTLTTTASDCGLLVQGVDERAKLGNVAVEGPIALTAFDGTCDMNESQEHIGTVQNGIIASCDSNDQAAGVISFETAVVTFTATEGTGVARIYLINVPLNGDCVFEMDVYYEKL